MKHLARPSSGWLALVFVLAIIVGCGGSTVAGGRGECPEGETVSCRCDDGRTGQRACGSTTCTCPGIPALVSDPAALEFGEVVVGETHQLTVQLRDLGSSGVRLSRLEFTGSGAEQLHLPASSPGLVPPGAGVSVTVVFAPTAIGVVDAVLRVVPDDPALAVLEVPVTGRSPGAVLACSPGEVDLGDVPVGASAEAAVVCTNAGVAGTADEARIPVPVIVVEAPFTISEEEPWPTEGLAVGESVTLVVQLEATTPGPVTGNLSIDSSAGSADVPLSATVVVAPCEVEVPARLAWDEDPTQVEVTIRNPSETYACTVEQIALCPGSDPAYGLGGGPFEDVVLPPGGTFSFVLLVHSPPRPCGAGESGGCIEYVLSAGESRFSELPCGSTGELGVRAAPTALTFHQVVEGCESRAGEVELINVSAEARTFRRAEFFAEGTSAEFELRSQPPAGTRILPGGSVSLGVVYRPIDGEPDSGTLFAWIDGQDQPIDILLSGTSRRPTTVTDTFVQSRWPMLDVLVVLDNGTTMSEESGWLVGELAGLPAYLESLSFDYRLAVTTTGLAPAVDGTCPGGVAGGEDGRFFPVDGVRPRIVSRALPNATSVWTANLSVGTCQTAAPQPLEAAVRALSAPLATSLDDPGHPEPDDGNLGFLRPDAHLAVLVASDRDDASPGTPASYHQALQDLKGPRNLDRLSFHVIGGGTAGCTATDGRSGAPTPRLLDVTNRTVVGSSASICAAEWTPPSSFPGDQPRTCFFLGNPPWDRNENGVVSDLDGELIVLLDGAVVPAREQEGEVHWTYGVDDASVCFAPSAVPQPGTLIQFRYYQGCIN